MRVNCRLTHRSLKGQFPLAVVAASLLFAGCQTPPFDHVDAASSGFNANHMPTTDRHDTATAGSPSATATTNATETNSTAPTSSAAGNEATIVENLNLGHREAALNRLAQAEAYYRRVLEIQPDNSVANHRLAVIADKNHDYARAEHYYLTALRREPRNPDLLSDLGYSYLLQGRREDSERCLTAATGLDPSHAKALHNLSLLYAANGDYDRSFDALRRAEGESEARVKIASLFPKGRPEAGDKDAAVASFQPMDSTGIGTPAAVNAASPTPASTQPAATVSGSPPTSISRAPSGRVPDSEINDRFAAIDREPAPLSASTSTGPVPTTSVSPSAMAANGLAAAQATPGTDPLASMPLWSPVGSSLQTGKAPSAFEFDASRPSPAQAPPQRPRVVATDISPADDNSKSPTILSRRDALSAFDAKLQKENAAGGGQTQSNGAAVRDPLIVDGTRALPGDPSDPQPAANASAAAPFNTVPPIRIQPRSNPEPLFEPLDDFGPGNDFAPSDKVAVPAWPATNGGASAPSGNSGDAGPVIRPGSPN